MFSNSLFFIHYLNKLFESIHIIISIILNIGDILIISECPSESYYHYLLLKKTKYRREILGS